MWKASTAIREDANDFHPVIERNGVFHSFPSASQGTYAEAMAEAERIAWARNFWRRLFLFWKA